MATESAVEAARTQFGRIDVVVNNAGVSYKGYFEEMSPQQVEQQLQQQDEAENFSSCA